MVSVNVLGSTPFNIAVGGTMFNEHGQDSKYWNSANNTYFGSALSYIPEMVWNESCTVPQCGQNAGLWATGGGASVYFHKPSWQTGFGDSMRDVPDVSLTAAGHDPYLLCLEGSCVPDAQGRFSIWLVSGTSAAAPSFAGIMALVDQKMGARQGQANYVLYRLAASNPGTCNGSSTTTLPTSNCIFNDTTVGNNAVPGESGYNTTAGKYQSGKGYDLATGLGSMNVANLVSKWNTVTFNPTNTTLVLNSGAAVNVPHGTLIDYAITVAPQSGTGTPTGDVALMQSTPWSRAIALSTLTGGAASGQTNLLPGGNYYMGAHYSGDKTFAASDSGSSFVMITPETSHTALQVGGGFDGSGNIVPFPGGPYGSFMYLRADVGGSSGVGVPSGYVMFTDNGSPIGTYSLNSQGNTTTPDGFFSIPAGTHSLGAQYSSDPSFASSTSTPVSVTVTQAGSSGSVGYAGAAKGANLTATIATNSGGNPPTGTVTFSVDGSPVASPVAVSGRDAVLNPFLAILFGTAPPVRLGAQAAGSLFDSALPNGPHTVVATYNGDANYAASTSAPFAFNLQPDFVLNSSGNSISISAPGATGSLNVAISQLDNFTGTVTFACSGLPLESTCTFSPASIKGSGQTVVTVKTTAPRSSRLNSPPFWPLGLGATGVGIAGIFCLGAPVNRSWRHNLFGVVLFTLVLGAIGCGGGSGGSGGQHDPGTGTGTYTVTVTATSGALRHQVSFRMVVQ
jgi:hypothetical protein